MQAEDSEIHRLGQELVAMRAAGERGTAPRIALLERAVGLARSNAEAARVLHLPQLYSELAEEYIAAGQADDARETLYDAVLCRGLENEPDLRRRLAQTFRQAGQTDETLYWWLQFKAVAPDDVQVHYHAGLAYAEAGKHEIALIWLTDGLRLAIGSGSSKQLVEQLADARYHTMYELSLEHDGLQDDAADFRPRHASPSISDVLDQFLAEQRECVSAQEFGSHETVVRWLREDLNNFSEDTLAEYDRSRWDDAYSAGDHEAYCHLFGPEKLPDAIVGMGTTCRCRPGPHMRRSWTRAG